MIRKIINILLNNETLLIALASGLLAVLFRLLKDTFTSIWNWIEEKIYFKVTITQESKLFDAMNEWYVRSNPGKIKNIFARFNVNHVYGRANYRIHITPLDSLQLSSWEGATMLIKKRTLYWKEDGEIVYDHEYTITSFAEEGVRDFLNYLEDTWNQKQNEGLHIVLRGEYHGDSNSFSKVIYKSFDDLFFDGKKKLIKHLDLYLESEALYRKKKITYKTSILLGGSPGNGKTCAGFAIADYTRRPIYHVNPRSFATDESFQNYIMNIERGSVILMEDVDSFFGNRENGTESKTFLSFSSILNTLDGLFSPHDVIFVMTTNKPEELDEALVRKGRLDLKIKFENPTGIEINNYLSWYFGEEVNCFSRDFQSLKPMVNIEDICRKSDGIHEAILKIKEING